MRQTFSRPIGPIGTCTRRYSTYRQCSPVRPVTRRVCDHVIRYYFERGHSAEPAFAAETAANLTTTQEHLSTGKKVNTAFDNPTSYFQSQSLDNRASDLSALLDQIGQAQQTLDAANNGLTSLTSLLQQALSTAQQAQAATNDTDGATTGTVDLTATRAAAGNLLIATGGTTYTVSVAASASLSSIEAAINGTAGLGFFGRRDGDRRRQRPPRAHLQQPEHHLYGVGRGPNGVWPLGHRGDRNQHHAQHARDQLQLAADPDRPVGQRRLLQRRQPAQRQQPDGQLQRDRHQHADHQRRDRQPHRARHSTSIAAGGFQNNTTITSAETAINAAITTVRAQTETFGTNSSTISTRQQFETNMINTLQTGASNLVLADQNQESANLLTLQTQQQLEISALSIANQANQSVLKLFG